MQVRTGGADLHELCERQLLHNDERERLEQLQARPQIVWVWIARTFQRLAAAGKLPSRLLTTLYGICMRARTAVGGVFAQLDTQLPFSYVHLVSVVVHANNILVAAKCGTMAAVAISHLRHPETSVGKVAVSSTDAVQALLLQCLQAIGVPLTTVGLLTVGVLVADPINDGLQDFPRSAYHVWLRDECESFQTAAEEAPKELAHVADLVEAMHPHLVHDCVCVV